MNVILRGVRVIDPMSGVDREGLDGPADLALVGDEKTVRADIERVAAAGATDFLAAEFGASDAETSRTRELLRSFI